jgi:hypothetical protein
MNIRQRMGLSIPAAKAEIQPANTCEVIVDDDKFLVVRPEGDIIYE